MNCQSYSVHEKSKPLQSDDMELEDQTAEDRRGIYKDMVSLEGILDKDLEWVWVEYQFHTE